MSGICRENQSCPKIKTFKTSEEYLEKICSDTKYVLLRNEVSVSDSVKYTEIDEFESKSSELYRANVDIFSRIQGVMSRFFPSEDNEEDENERKVEIKLEATPSLSQMKELISYSSALPENGWDDVIFIDGDNRATSIRKHRIVERISLPPAIEAYSCDQIYEVISGERDKFFPYRSDCSDEVELVEVEGG